METAEIAFIIAYQKENAAIDAKIVEPTSAELPKSIVHQSNSAGFNANVSFWRDQKENIPIAVAQCGHVNHFDAD